MAFQRFSSPILILCLVLVPTAWCQQYPFLPVAGSPRDVHGLFQDSQGRLWLTGGTPAYFDGTRFFALRDYGYNGGASQTVGQDATGGIWIGGETGLYHFGGGRLEAVSSGFVVSVIGATPDVAIAAVGPPGKGIPENTMLVRVSRAGKTWKSEAVLDLKSPGTLTLDSATESILYPQFGVGWNEIRVRDVLEWKPGTQLKITAHPQPNFPEAGHVQVVRDRLGCVWIGGEDYDVYQCPGDAAFREAPAGQSTMRYNLHEAPNGEMVLHGYSSVAIGRPGAFHVATIANGLPGIFDAIEARDGTIWLASAEGLYRFANPFRLEFWTARDGVDVPAAITRVGDNIYAGLNRKVGVLSADRRNWQTLVSFEQVGTVQGLLPAENNTLIAALMDGGAQQFGADGKIVARMNYLKGGYGLRLARVSEQEVWLGGLGFGRLVRHGTELKNDELYPFKTQPFGNVLDVQYEAVKKQLWACYNHGLVVRHADGKWQEITTKDGLQTDACWSLAALPNGDVWYGYYNTPAFALVRPEGPDHYTVKQYHAGDADVVDPQSFTFDADGRGWLWRGGEHGVSVADPADAEAGHWVYLNQSDGFPGEDANGGSFFADTDGSVWWGADINISHFSPPDDFLKPNFAPQIFVSAFSVKKGAPQLADLMGELPSGTQVVAHLGSLQFDRRNAMKVRYRVLPEQAEWKETRGLDLPLGNLPWGPHTLEVQARLFTGPWSESLRRTFAIRAPLWLRWPLLLAYGVVFATLAAFYFLVYRKRLLRLQTTLPDLAPWRMAVLLPEVEELAGTVLSERYEVGQLLARGGFANVMKGYDSMEKRPCAIKIFRDEVGKNESMKKRFEQEVSALQHVGHPHVVSIYAHGVTASDVPYLVMEFVEGQSLREILSEGGLGQRRTARLLRQLAEALEAIHSKGICHRDVKPENLMVRNVGTANEELVLIDFSISIVKEANAALHGLSRAAGTFEYMAPEQAIGYAQPSSDVYSLAKLLVEMLTGTRLATLLPNASMDLPERVKELLAGLPIHLSEASITLISEALQFDPARRPQSAAGFAASIARDLEMEPRMV